MNASFSEIAAVIESAENILVASHVRPDGDALGSTIAFALWLRSARKTVSAWNEHGVTQKYRYLPHYDLIGAPDSVPRAFDVIVALDNSVKSRLGTVLDSVASVRTVINIDHHISNECYGDLNYVDSTAPATGQIIYEFFKERKVPLSPDMAANLFAAISTDTGSFQYAGTDSRTFEAASALVAAGVDVAALSRKMYDSQPRRRLDLLRHTLNEARFTCDGHLASFSLSLAAVDQLGVLPEDNEGVIDHLRSVEGVVAAVFFEELPEGKIRISARSKDPRVDVCAICKVFGGGGHPLAAGARVRGTLAEVEAKFLEAVCHEIHNRN
ncbi:MAG TPA: bifunctional oligoribonuclease/PAP phosphatase NrnA [Terrimicrobiaceae bacterium]